jgi:hypothetical protein
LCVQGIGGRSGDSDLDAVFAMLVDEGDGLAGQLYAVNGQVHFAWLRFWSIHSLFLVCTTQRHVSHRPDIS